MADAPVRRLAFMKKMRIAALVLSVLCLQGRILYGELSAGRLELEIDLEWNYFLYLPEEYAENDGEEFPLLLFLHGGGESGSNLEKVKKHGPPAQIAAGREFPFIVLAPQNPHKKRLWDDSAVMALLDEIEKRYRVDKKRVYLTGLSRGAYGAWRLAVQYPDRFAALVAISGEAPMNYASWVGKIPVWVFHGDSDTSIDVSSSRRMVEELRENGNPARLTIYENTGHDAWTQTYNDPEVYEWMLKQSR